MKHISKTKESGIKNKTQALQQLVAFFEQYSQLINSEVPLLRALEISASSVHDPTLQQMLLELIPKMASGQSITDSFKKFSEYLSPFHIAIIEIAEQDGHLEDGFLRVADVIRHDMETSAFPEFTPAKQSHTNKPTPSSVKSSSTSDTELLAKVCEELSDVCAQLAKVSRELAHLSKNNQKSPPNPRKKAKSKK